MERPDTLANPHADRVARVARLSGRSARRRHGQFLIEGPGPVAALVACRPGLVRDVYLSPEWWGSEISQEARRGGLYVHDVTEEVSRALSENSQGILAVAESNALCASLEALALPRLVVVLPEINDPGNLGTLIRVADATGADAVFVGPGSAELTNPKVVRASAGSLFHLPVVKYGAAAAPSASFADIVHYLKSSGAQLVGADARAERLVAPGEEWLCHPTAWVFGHEARGLPEEASRAVDFQARIPLYGRAESLNVAAAAAICLYTSRHALG